MAKKMPTKGAKAKKGAAGRAASRGKGNARNNPRAFKAASGPKSMQRQAHRALEKQERQYHVNLQDRSIEATTQPPIVVVVVGPSGVGAPLFRLPRLQWASVKGRPLFLRTTSALAGTAAGYNSAISIYSRGAAGAHALVGACSPRGSLGKRAPAHPAMRRAHPWLFFFFQASRR
jgi:hypothetical protein